MSQVGGPQNYNPREGTFSGYEEEDHGDLFSQVGLLIGMRRRQAEKQGHLCATYYKHTPVPLWEKRSGERFLEKEAQGHAASWWVSGQQEEAPSSESTVR
ncbi:hypothetical protein AVEN_103108-1 [Araneus ventricosus]|uniref:Uncharacterized protein n=1 Tax=Araneus ventricosus TaxID=182803 RepID=A0A4Y2SSY2_ARAVE|nr:hypothetical protein AVEN_103108-1 [Araneus ventricosus]